MVVVVKGREPNAWSIVPAVEAAVRSRNGATSTIGHGGFPTRSSIRYSPTGSPGRMRVPKPSNLEHWGSEPTVHGYKGGDLIGIVEHLDHLQDLGVTALYLNPIFQSASNHRYHPHDFDRVDPLLGGDSAFDRLVEGLP